MDGQRNEIMRCAVYTRKSVEMGLEQEFNSLDAQYAACKAYVESHKYEGWQLVNERYDDGGFSGGNLDRPAFQRLIKDIRAKKVDVVVCYKIDRISRSLLDFSDVMRILEDNNAKFVSVTQEFSNTTSSGRMMMNLLMTFAQFEREQTSERVRDKMLATRRRGLWAGGSVPYGYMLSNKCLIPNPQQKDNLLRIFRLFAEHGQIKPVIRQLTAEGIMRFPERGVKWSTHSVSVCLRNVIYVGRISCGAESFPGKHEALVPQELWDKVQKILNENAPKDGVRDRMPSDALLGGIIRCGTCGSCMSYSWTRKSTTGAKYGYYYDNRDSKRGESTCPVRSVPAGPVEALAEREVLGVLQTPTVIELVARKLRCTAYEVRDALGDPSSFWSRVTPADKRRLFRLVLEKILVYPRTLEFCLRTEGYNKIIQEVKDGHVNR